SGLQYPFTRACQPLRPAASAISMYEIPSGLTSLRCAHTCSAPSAIAKHQKNARKGGLAGSPSAASSAVGASSVLEAGSPMRATSAVEGSCPIGASSPVGASSVFGSCEFPCSACAPPGGITLPPQA